MGAKPKRPIGKPSKQMIVRVHLKEEGKVTRVENITIYDNVLKDFNFDEFLENLYKYLKTTLEGGQKEN